MNTVPQTSAANKGISKRVEAESVRLRRLAVSPPILLTQGQARLLLPALIGRLSLDLHDRGWISSLPFTLWEAVIGKPTEPFGDEDVALFRHLSEVAGGWAHFDGKEGPRFVVRAVWAAEFSKWRIRQPRPAPGTMKEWDRARKRMRRHAAKKLRLTPDELGALADVVLEIKDPIAAAELRVESMRQGWYGKPTREELEAGVRHVAGVAMTVTIRNGKMMWFEKLLARFKGTQPIAFQGLENDRWTFAFTVPDAKSAQALVARLKRGGVRQFEIS